MNKSVAIIGAGTGGLAAGMLLQAKGYDVSIYEKNDHPGGRNAEFTLGEYSFDTGPTFLMMPHVLSEIFQSAGLKVSDYIDMQELDPMYRLSFRNGVEFMPTTNIEKMLKHVDEVFPGDKEGYLRFLDKEGKKFGAIFPCLTRPYSSVLDFMKPSLFKAARYIKPFESVYDVTKKYFLHEELRLSMTFQAKYLGMSPWHCPGFFSILPYLEHKWGVHYVKGGLSTMTEAMAKAFEDIGGTLHLSQPVSKIVIENKQATGFMLKSGTKVEADSIVINPDFAYSMTQLVDKKHRKKFTDTKLKKMKYSCSTFMMYLGVRKTFDTPHHNIFFAEDYKGSVDDIIAQKPVNEDFSVYVQNSAVTDSTRAPEGCTALYILVPVSNLESQVDWKTQSSIMRERTLDILEKHTDFKGLRDCIEEERITTPLDWERHHNVYNGAVFSMAHTLDQMLILRPHNEFEEFKNCYLVGGGTHPGSGLPTILESAKICADLISKKK